MSMSMPFPSENTSAFSLHYKRMAISNITSPSLSNSTLIDSTPSSYVVNSSLSSSVTSSPCLSSHDKVPKSPCSPMYTLCSSYEAPNTPIPFESRSKLTTREKSYGSHFPSPPLPHMKPDYEKKQFGHPYKLQQRYRNRNNSVESNYTTEPTIHNSFNDYYQTLDSNRSSPVLVLSPLSLNERRQRNKAASAKYRAKKNQQHGEMRSLISSLTKENEFLQRQLDCVKLENNRLKANSDRLRGKLVAEKMLKKLLSQNEEKFSNETKQLEDECDVFIKRESTSKDSVQEVLNTCKYKVELENNTSRNVNVWRPKNCYQDFVKSEN